MENKTPRLRFKCYTDDWERSKAGALFVEYSDKGHPDLPVLSATQDMGMVNREEYGKVIFHDKNNEYGYKRVLPGQYVIHLRSFQGGFAHSSIEGITSPAYTVFGHKDTEKHNNLFWKYIFCSEDFKHRLETVTYGIRDGKSISYDEFLDMDFTYPSNVEQMQIAKTLVVIDNLINLHQRKYEKLLDLKKSLLEKMFPSEEDSTPKIRLKGYTEAWKQYKVADVCVLRGRIGFRGYTKEDLVPEHMGAITFSPSDIDSEGHVSLDNNDYISFRKYDESPEIMVREGDILFTKTASIGKIGYVEHLCEKATINPQFALITPSVCIDGYFMFLSMRQESFMKKIRDITGGSSIPTMSQEKIKGLTFIAPTIEEQKQISITIQRVDSFIGLQRRTLDKLNDIKKSLLERMFV